MDEDIAPIGQLLETPGLADALGSDRFKLILDQVPVGIVVSDISDDERIVYANHEFERLTGRSANDVVGQGWNTLAAFKKVDDEERPLPAAVVGGTDYVGAFAAEPENDRPGFLDVWSNAIEDERGVVAYRLLAMAERILPREAGTEDIGRALMAKEFELRELQHRVKNNLQLITSLIRVEARGLANNVAGERFDLLAGRVDALALLYRSFASSGGGDRVDLGVYLSEIASGVMRAHATEGVHLDLQVDTWPVSVNVAMPTGLVVNELLTNALKHAFHGRAKGLLQLHAVVDRTGCRVVVADDGVGLPEGVRWPEPGRMSALFVRALRQNAKASIEVTSEAGRGTRAEIRFARADAAGRSSE